MGGRTVAAISVALMAGSMLGGCSASLPPEYQPKPYSLTYARKTLVAGRPSVVLVNRDSVRDARIGKFEERLLGQATVCLAYDWRDRSGNYTGLKAYFVAISPDHGSVVQVTPADAGHSCDPNELQPFPEFNGPAAAPASKPPARPKPPIAPRIK